MLGSIVSEEMREGRKRSQKRIYYIGEWVSTVGSWGSLLLGNSEAI